MKKTLLFSVLLGLAMLVAPILQAEKHEPAPIAPMPTEFERLTNLVGNWEGTTQEGDKAEPVKVTYELISNGSAVMERLFPGTPKEMVSIYHRDGKGLAMTHYCAIGNHPYMQLKKTTPEALSFEMQGTKGIGSAKEPHIHALTLTAPDNDHLKHEWIFYDNGKKQGVTAFNLARKK